MRRAHLLVFVVLGLCAIGPDGLAQGDETSDRMFVLRSPFEDGGPSVVQALDIGEGGVPVPAETYETHAQGRALLSQQDLAFSGDGRYLFATNNEDRSVSAFAVSHRGQLAAVPGSPFEIGGVPTRLAAHPERPWLFVSEWGLSMFEIGEGGSLTPGPRLPVSFTRGIEVDPEGRYLYAAVMFGPDQGVRGFTISPSGMLNEMPGSPFRFDSSRPKDLVISSDGRRVYVLDLDAGLATFAADSSGELELLRQEDLGDFYSQLELSSDDRFLYVAKPYRPDIRGFEISEDGLPQELPSSPFPGLFAVTKLLAASGPPRLYVLTRETKEVLTTTIDESGQLTEIGPPRPLPGNLVPNGAVYWSPSFLVVSIDVLPGVEPNRLAPGSPGVVPVALLGSAEFDVTSIDPASLRFGPSQAEPCGIEPIADPDPDAGYVYRLPDVNADGYGDLIVPFDLQQSGIECGATEAALIGERRDGIPFRGVDEIVTVGCE